MTNASLQSPRYDVGHKRILFLDNEDTCWEGAPPPGESGETIEIGIAELDVRSLVITRSSSYLVRPVRSSVSPYCTELTGITPELLKAEGRPLPQVFRTIAKEYGPGSKQWLAWGADRRGLDRDAAALGIVSPMSAAFVDMGLDFKIRLGSSRGIGLREAMRMLGLEWEGRAHSGENDAVQTARLWAEMARRARAEYGYGDEPDEGMNDGSHPSP